MTINGDYSVDVPARSSETIVEFLPPAKPLMPWNVVVTSSTGDEIGTQPFAGPVDQLLTVSSGEMTTEPFSIDC